MDGEGMVVEGLEELSRMGRMYNYWYYGEEMEELGFEKEGEWVE